MNSETPMVDRLLASWETDQSMDTPRDARRMQDMVALARLLERSRERYAAECRMKAASMLDLKRFEWLLDQMSYQRCGPHYGYSLDVVLAGEDAYDAVCRGYDAEMGRPENRPDEQEEYHRDTYRWIPS